MGHYLIKLEQELVINSTKSTRELQNPIKEKYDISLHTNIFYLYYAIPEIAVFDFSIAIGLVSNNLVIEF